MAGLGGVRFRAACLNKKRPDASQAPGQSREEALPFKGWRIHQFPMQALCQSGADRRRRTGLCRGAGEAALGTNRRWAFPYCRDGGAGRRQYAELRSIGIRDYRVLEGRQRVGRIRFVIERMPGVWLWNVTVHLSKVQSADQRMRRGMRCRLSPAAACRRTRPGSDVPRAVIHLAMAPSRTAS